MKITGLSAQVRDSNRVNVSVDGKYRFSLDLSQVVELGIKVGKEYIEKELVELEQESQYGKVYMRALEYSFVRPRSERELKDYLRRKTIARRNNKGELKPGVSEAVTRRVFEALMAKGRVDNEAFAKYWVENRRLNKGVSQRHLRAELMQKGVESAVIDRAIADGERDDDEELRKVISRKRAKYPDDQKLTAYLVRQGFSYDAIKAQLSGCGED